MPVIQKLNKIRLNLYWHIHHLFSRIEQRSAFDRLTAHENLDPQVKDLIDLDLIEKEIYWLRSKLISSPYWQEGHLRLAQAALHLGRAKLAYGSATAYQKLSNSDQERFLARHLIAKSLLQAGDGSRALQILEQLKTDAQFSVEIHEDLAAAYIATDNLREAYNVFSGLDQTSLTPSAKEAYLYVKGKIRD